MAKNGIAHQGRFNVCCVIALPTRPAPPSLPGIENPTKFLHERVKLLVERQHTHARELKKDRPLDLSQAQVDGIPRSHLLDIAYEQGRQLFAKDKDPFGYGTLFMNPDKQKPFWAIWVWGRRLDEFVDGVNGSHTTDEALDRWGQSTLDAFKGRPWDIYDVALADTVSKYPIDIQLFKDLIEGTRSDMRKKRFETFEDLYLYKYYSCTTLFLMFIPMMGIAPESKASLESIYHAGIIFGAGLSLTDSLRDVGEDARMGRIYIPRDELLQAGLSEEDVFRGEVTDKWRKFMKGQIKRAREYLDEGAQIITELHGDVRCALWTTMLMYRQHLDMIEANDYNNFTKKVSVGNARKFATLMVAYGKSIGWF
ncbi:similar to PHYTOENE SYNTHASE [Actinidia rufa]|uniref:15-cis-phytoene synthase n=1 Tax=Actinidia rufa TaxID=165716 RepID=A0A7J0FV38_9ERIC|nr:similar to PHYTOENE SYNTHASE [Actinidia rufa]